MCITMRALLEFMPFVCRNKAKVFCILLCPLAVLDLRVGHTMDILSPYISVFCYSDWLFLGEFCPCIDVVHPGRVWSSLPACTWLVPCIISFSRQLPCFLMLWPEYASFLALIVSNSSLVPSLLFPSPPTDNVWAMVIVWRVRGEIIWPALCCCAS